MIVSLYGYKDSSFYRQLFCVLLDALLIAKASEKVADLPLPALRTFQVQ
jgi:hypothetical protein